MTKREIARKYRRKFPDFPNLKLARIIYKEHNLIFSGVEEARNVLRFLEGHVGGRKRDQASSSDKEEFHRQARPYNPYKLPQSYETVRHPFILPQGCNNILLISELHIPYHNINAVTLAFEYGIQSNCNTVFINGDLIDNAQVSKFERDMRKRSVKEEFDLTRSFLESLRAAFPKASIFWLKGNHCVRWEKFLMTKVHEIWDDPYFHLEERLRLNDLGVKIINDDTLVKAGKLSITHGHHVFKGVFTPVNPARGAFLRSKQSVIVGHLHRASYHPEIDLDGNVIGCWSTGCLCELKPNYSPLVSNSQHGFAHILIDSGGNFTVKNYQIIHGEIH